MSKRKFRLAILTGRDSEATCSAITPLLGLPNVEVSGILLDTELPSLQQRSRNLRRNLKREGYSYLLFRLGEAIFDLLEDRAGRVVLKADTYRLLRDSFPERAFSLSDFTRLHGIPVLEVGNLNSPQSAQTLRSMQADLGVVIGTRILKASTFAIPRLGCLNLHKGKVPEYRGQPAGFWEIYDGQKMGGVTVHFVDQGLDTGDIVGEACVPVHSKDSPDTLRRKLDMQGAALLASCVSQVVEGTVVRRPQPKSEFKARTSPTREQRRSVEKKLGMDGPQQLRWLYAIKTLLYLAIYHSGILRLIRAWHRRAPKGRGCIILYHRVNDLTRDVLTISEVRFAEHLIAMGRTYPLVTTTEIVQKVKQHSHLSGSAIAIHFDDCYRDVYTNASRLLSHLKVPACAFISSGFIGTDRVFPHDALKCPFHLENLKSDEVTGLVERGFEIGSHTVNHADLGQVGVDDAFTELSESKKDLEVLLKRSVKLLSYPYGKKLNIRPEVTEIVRKVGYEAMFSAYGGYINGHDNEFDIRRIGVSGQYRALDLLMAIEGVALENLKQSWGESKLRRGRLD